MEMTPDRWRWSMEYCRQVFGQQDDHLATLMDRAVDAGLPDIAVSADVGRLLNILTAMTPGRLAIEVGTLAGYSAIWLARGLATTGRLITIEREPAHASFAREQFQQAGVDDRIELREGLAIDLLTTLTQELTAGSVDVVFLDADKEQYPAYWNLLRPLIAPGGLLLADNALGAGSWWIDNTTHPDREAMDRMNRLIAADPEFEAVAVPLRQGVLIGRRSDSAPD